MGLKLFIIIKKMSTFARGKTIDNKHNIKTIIFLKKHAKYQEF